MATTTAIECIIEAAVTNQVLLFPLFLLQVPIAAILHVLSLAFSAAARSNAGLNHIGLQQQPSRSTFLIRVRLMPSASLKLIRSHCGDRYKESLSLAYKKDYCSSRGTQTHTITISVYYWNLVVVVFVLCRYTRVFSLVRNRG